MENIIFGITQKSETNAIGQTADYGLTSPSSDHETEKSLKLDGSVKRLIFRTVWHRFSNVAHYSFRVANDATVGRGRNVRTGRMLNFLIIDKHHVDGKIEAILLIESLAHVGVSGHLDGFYIRRACGTHVPSVAHLI